MSGEDFQQQESGATAKAAFDDAVAQARYDHGHSGYTGTIAEKNEFVMVDVPEGEDPSKYVDFLATGVAKDLPSGQANPFNDKWGPAGCVQISEGEWLFFGCASS